LLTYRENARFGGDFIAHFIAPTNFSNR
jgi:hypothetical protein